MKTRIIHTRFWKDEYISNLTQLQKLVFIYLLSNEQVNMCGIYELPDKYIKADLDISQDQLNKIKDKFMDDGKIIFSGSWIKIINHNKYNSYGKGMQEKALDKELSQVPEYMSNTSIDTSMHTRPNTEIRNKKQEIRKEGGMGETKISAKKYSQFSDLDEFCLREIASDYEIPIDFVNKIHEDMRLYLGANGKWNKYKDFNLALRNWVRRDADKLKLQMARSNNYKPKGGVFDARGL